MKIYKLHSKLFYSILLFIFPLILPSCGKVSGNQNPEKEEVNSPEPGNPIYQADPSIFYHEGTYYLYGTNDNNADNGFLVYTSKDLNKWKANGYALRKGEAFGDWGFWAPQVWTHNGKFYMAYTANEKIAIAESTKPQGPFKQSVKQPLLSSYGQIDPYIFIDNDGKKYLYHVRLGGGNRIWVAEMTDDFSAMKAGTNTECITATPGTWEHVNAAAGRVAEGPTVIKENGLYYLFYSGNDFRHKDYAVGYATSNSVFGPWTRYAGNPIIHESVTNHPGSGHGDIVKGQADSLFYVFHTHNSGTSVIPRKSALLKLKLSRDGANQTVFSIEKGSFKYLNFSY